MLGAGLVWPVLALCVALPRMPESPRWLLSHAAALGAAHRASSPSEAGGGGGGARAAKFERAALRALRRITPPAGAAARKVAVANELELAAEVRASSGVCWCTLY